MATISLQWEEIKFLVLGTQILGDLLHKYGQVNKQQSVVGVLHFHLAKQMAQQKE